MTEKEIVSKLCSHQKLERDKGLGELRVLLQQDASSFSTVATLILSTLKTSSTWESKHGCLKAIQLLLESGISASVDTHVLPLLPQLLEDIEPRVRLSAGELLGCVCRCSGPAAFEQLKETILSGIVKNIERDVDSMDTSESKYLAKLTHEQGIPTDVARIFHDTAGWKALESYMNALKFAAEGCGTKFYPYINKQLLELLFQTLSHTNRFVRETGFHVLAIIAGCFTQLKQDGCISDDLLMLVSRSLAIGLSDNWSQVRMAACVATRHFFSSVGNVDPVYLDILIPPMCLNRYYVAEGVRVYSQETWLAVTKRQGVHLVEEHITSVVKFYIAQSNADNHAVREAACACIAELGSKMSKDLLRPHVTSLLSTLLVCFKDDCWPVRDAACLACGNFISCFPAESLPQRDEVLLLCLTNLEDTIPSVRQGAAISISQIVQAYGDEVFENVFSILGQRLPLVKDQPAEGSSHIGLDVGPATFGVVKRVHDNDPNLHSGQQMYSCGSLAPKMRKGLDDTGQVSDGERLFQKTSQPWEKSEGCVQLLAEIAKLKTYNSQVSNVLPIIAETTKYKQYVHHHAYFEAILKLLPIIAQSLGKRDFKKHFNLFIDAIFYGISCDSALVQVAATECITLLSQLIGKMITRGRIEQHNPKYLNEFDKIVH